MADIPFERTVPRADPDTPVLDGACRLVDFWQWAFSDLVANDVRGAFAEFIVGHALGVLDAPRGLWTAWDLDYGDARIEVKTTGDVQAWAPTGRPPKPTWGIGRKRGWDPVTNTFAPEPLRSADVYVLCHWQGTDAAPLSPATLEAWKFYVTPTRVLDERHLERKALSLRQLNELVDAGDALPAIYSTLKATVDAALRAR